MTRPDQQLDAWIDAHVDGELRDLQALVQVPADTLPGNNAPHAERAAALLATMANTAERVDGKRHGRASAVRRSDCASDAFALEALESLAAPQPGGCPAVQRQGGVDLLFTDDGDFGGEFGPGWLLQNGLTEPDDLLAAGFSDQVVTAHSGCLQMAVTVHGQMAHAAIPDAGVDALQGAVVILNPLDAQNQRGKAITSQVAGLTHPCLSVGRIEAGTNTSALPGKVVFERDRRRIPEENPVEVDADMRRQRPGEAGSAASAGSVERCGQSAENCRQFLPLYWA